MSERSLNVEGLRGEVVDNLLIRSRFAKLQVTGIVIIARH
jgi:hypothetical protein